MLTGVGILGTGGGGDPVTFGKPLVDWDYQRGRVYEITDPNHIKDDAFIVCGGYMGSVNVFKSVGDLLEGWETRYELHEAMKISERITGKKVNHLVPFELGGTNTTVMLGCGRSSSGGAVLPEYIVAVQEEKIDNTAIINKTGIIDFII